MSLLRVYEYCTCAIFGFINYMYRLLLSLTVSCVCVCVCVCVSCNCMWTYVGALRNVYVDMLYIDYKIRVWICICAAFSLA
jgi:hypothetical protein